MAGICAVLLPLTAAAVPVTYEFSGRITMGGGSTPPEGEMFVPIIPFGAAFTGSFTYETETPATYDLPGYLAYDNPIVGATISFGAGGEFGVFNFVNRPSSPTATQSSSISFINDLEYNGNPPYDQFGMYARLDGAPGDSPNMYRFLSFGTGDYTAQQIPVGQTLLDPLPVEAFLAGFHQLGFGYSLYDDAGQWIDGADVGSQQITLTRVSTSVPEPGTLALFGLGIAGVFLAQRRRAVRMDS
jgi:hypothetical protein